MKAIVAKSQVALGPARGAQLALSGMSYRMFRSAVTIAILALATAFLVHMLVYGLLAGQTERNAYRDLQRLRAFGEQITRLAHVDAPTKIMATLAAGEPSRLREYRGWAKGDASEFDRAHRVAERLSRVRQSLVELPPTAQAVLLGDLTADELLESLRQPEQLTLFTKKLAQLQLGSQAIDQVELVRLVSTEMGALHDVTARIGAGHLAAVTSFAAHYPEKSAEVIAAEPPADFERTLQKLGFFKDAELSELAAFASNARDERTIGELLLEADVRSQVARELNLLPKDVDLKKTLAYAADGGHAEWLAGVLAQVSAPKNLTGERVHELAEAYGRRSTLEEMLGDRVPNDGGGFLGLPERLRWLVVLSFLVCVVGVANAMLMSVTERFTEIATMKCLGAMDGFVMMMFVFEAAIQGVIGGLAGLVLGLLLAALRGAVEYGGLFFAFDGMGLQLLLATLLSLLVGVVLAALAAVGPSWVAARLSPMEAMRVE
ncbi:MAG: ABC transporter permease [Polyangiaceae bacterium]|nr:ABC transporter permease [Polyangiaceae bacterium]